MKRTAAEIVVITLAVSMAISLVLITVFALYVALHSESVESTRVIAVTQVLTGWGGGVVGVLAAFVGYSFGRQPTGSTVETWLEKGPNSPR